MASLSHPRLRFRIYGFASSFSASHSTFRLRSRVWGFATRSMASILSGRLPCGVRGFPSVAAASLRAGRLRDEIGGFPARYTAPAPARWRPEGIHGFTSAFVPSLPPRRGQFRGHGSGSASAASRRADSVQAGPTRSDQRFRVASEEQGAEGLGLRAACRRFAPAGLPALFASSASRSVGSNLPHKKRRHAARTPRPSAVSRLPPRAPSPLNSPPGVQPLSSRIRMSESARGAVALPSDSITPTGRRSGRI